MLQEYILLLFLVIYVMASKKKKICEWHFLKIIFTNNKNETNQKEHVGEVQFIKEYHKLLKCQSTTTFTWMSHKLMLGKDW